MKRLELVQLKACPHCRRAVAYLMTEDGQHTLGIALDAVTARELSRCDQEPGDEKSLTDFLLQLLASSSYVPHHVVLDCNAEGFLSARVDVTTEILSCSPQEGVGFAVAARIPLYAVERIFEHRHLFHPPETEGEDGLVLPTRPKPTLH